MICPCYTMICPCCTMICPGVPGQVCPGWGKCVPACDDLAQARENQVSAGCPTELGDIRSQERKDMFVPFTHTPRLSSYRDVVEGIEGIPAG